MNERPIHSIIDPVTSDGMCGYDQYRQFHVAWEEVPGSERYTSTIVADLRGQKCLLCDKEWTASARELRDQRWDDRAQAHVHKTCYTRHLAFIDRQRWWGLVYGLIDTHKGQVKMEAVPDQYGGAWGTPWFRFSFRRVPLADAKDSDTRNLVIPQTLLCGPRRRVNAIRGERLTISQIEFLTKEFEDVTSTKGQSHERRDEYEIHSYNDEEDKRYVKTFLQMLGIDYVPKEEKAVTTT